MVTASCARFLCTHISTVTIRVMKRSPARLGDSHSCSSGFFEDFENRSGNRDRQGCENISGFAVDWMKWLTDWWRHFSQGWWWIKTHISSCFSVSSLSFSITFENTIHALSLLISGTIMPSSLRLCTPHRSRRTHSGPKICSNMKRGKMTIKELRQFLPASLFSARNCLFGD